MLAKYKTIWFVCCTGIHIIMHCHGEDVMEYNETGPFYTTPSIPNKANLVLREPDDSHIDVYSIDAMPILGPPKDLYKTQSKGLKYSDFDMEDAIQKIEALSQITEQMNKVNDLISQTDVENIYHHMIQAIDRVQDAIINPDNLYNFMKTNGILRILSTNLKNTHSALRTKLLLLLKDIYDLIPITAENLLPINIIDRLVEIFDTDKNLAIKAHALDILYKWLPKNPEAQVRVMKISGLETFYNQIEKLDIGVVQTLMDLFNKIIKEHLNVRNEIMLTDKVDGDKMKLYQSIGIFEHISNIKVCNGLLNIFEIMWSFKKNENDNIKLVLDLVTNVKPFCLKFYKKSKVTELVGILLKYIDNEEKKEYLEKLDLNVTNVKAILQEHIHEAKRVADMKDEF